MKVLTSIEDFQRESLTRPVVTLGFFDGFHKGHKALFSSLKNWAKEVEGTPLIITFENHPQVVLDPSFDENSFPYINSLEHRLRLFSEAGITHALVLTFDKKFSQLSPEDFLKNFLREGLGCRHFLMGFDSRFGHRARGDFSLASQLGPEMGLEVRKVEPLLQEGEKISSTQIRQWIREGEIEKASHSLGRKYSLMGQVIPGDSLGRKMGFPTANLRLKSVLAPPFGVYAVEVSLYEESFGEALFVRPGLVNVGLRPTLAGKDRRVEAHIPDFEGDLYGKYLEIRLLKKLRDEKKFENLDELVKQIRRDLESLKELIIETKPKEGNKKMKKLTALSWIFAFLLALVAVYLHQGPVIANKNVLYHHAAVEAKVRTIILDKYFRKVEDQQLHYGALKGMFSVLDPYSGYIPPKKVQDFDLDTTGKFGGLGIIIEIRDKLLTVVTPIQGSPAHKAGVLAGDKILKVKFQKKGQWIERDGDFENTEEARKVLIGRPGTQVILTVFHESTGEREDITVTRGEITLRSIKGVKILDKEKGIGYVRITSFQSDTTKDLVEALETFEKKGVHSLILDLRFNPGGLLDQAISVADQFLKVGIIVQTKGRTPSQYKVFRAKSQGAGLFLKQVILLLNRGSASASEIVAGALQDHHKALLLGERSWGKGSVQTIIEIPEKRDGEGRIIYSKIKLTTALYYTPNGRSIHRILHREKKASDAEEGGLAPDAEIKISAEEELGLMRQQNEEDIEMEKNMARGKNGLYFSSPDRKKIKDSFYQSLSKFDNLEWIEWKKARMHQELFVDRVLEKAVELLRNPKEYQRLLKK